MTNLMRRNNGLRNYDDFYDMVDAFFGNDLDKRDVFTSTFKVDVSEDDDKYLVEAELAGIKKEDVDINLDKGQLTLTVNKSTAKDESDKEKNYIHKERTSERMTRSMYFPNIDEANVAAKLEDGILEIEIPKLKEKDTQKKIEIK